MHSTIPPPFLLLAVAVSTLFASVAPSQCAPSWSITNGFGVDGEVRCAVEWDPDGAGPLGAHLVVGGLFVAAGGTPAANLAMFDLQNATWSAFGSGASGLVETVAVHPSGDLVVGGAFGSIDGVLARGIARRSGGTWQPLGSGVDVASGGVRELLCRANGEIVVGGKLVDAGGVPVLNIARWNGSAWSAMGAGLRANMILSGLETIIAVRDLVDTPNGVLAIGDFDASGALPLTAAAEWNGTAWSQVGTWPSTPLVRLESGRRSATGDLWVCGRDLGTGLFMRRWTGAAWIDMPMPAGGALALCALPNGNMALGSAGNFGVTMVDVWNGTSWINLGSSPLATLGTRIFAVEWLPSLGPDALAVGGRGITQMSGTAAQSLVLHRAATGWQGCAGCFSGDRAKLYVGREGELVVANGGHFGATTLGPLGRWTGSAWVTSPAAVSSRIDALAFDAAGRTLVSTGAGYYRSNGAGWTFVAPSIHTSGTILPLPNGNILSTNEFSGTLMRWNGSSWQGLNVSPSLLALHPNGLVIAAGGLSSFAHGSRLGAWDGTTWTDLDPADQINGWVNVITILPDGAIVAAGQFSFANRIARWDGTAWQPMGAGFNGEVQRLCVLADGRLLANGLFTASGSLPCNRWAIWNGLAWQAVPGAPVNVSSVVAHPNGDVWAITSTRTVARLATPCPANGLPLGNGCASSGGGNRLLAHGWPMLGATFHSSLQGLPAPSFAISVLGATTSSTPLSLLLPQGQPGCVLDVSPDITAAVFSANGFATIDAAVPSQPGLLGVAFHHQVITVELLPAGGLGPVTSTNSRTYTIGSVQ